MLIWRLYPLAVFAGLLASTAAAVALGAVLSFVALAAGIGEIDATALRRTDAAVAFLVLSVAAALAGGYVAARFAPGEEVVNAAAAGVALVAIGTSGAGPIEFPLWIDVVARILTIPSALAGGLLFLRRSDAR